MRHQFLPVHVEQLIPASFHGRHIQSVVTCAVCRKVWLILAAVPMKAVFVLQENPNKQRLEDFFKVFEDMVRDKANSFIDYHTTVEEGEYFECEGKEKEKKG